MKRMTSALTTASVMAMLALAACQTAPKDAGLLPEARNAVTQAESDPDVTKYSANELNRARQLLTNAEGAAKEKGATDKITAHYAYLAMQTARIAGQRAQEQVAMARIKAGETERQQILLSAREREAQRARNAAQDARAQAQDAQQQVAQAQAESQRLARQLEDMQASQTSRGIVLTLGDVLFDTGRAELKPGAARPIEQVAQFLSEHPERKVQIEGFTDSQGSDAYNMELSQKRADAVAMAIMQRGIAADRVRALGYGEDFPKASNSSPGSRQLNRRVEIIVSNGDESIPGRTASGSP
ncbi:MAG TPA: OmpA family protein [Steroidobacteraceae bacterium]|nr:OmpA family protein [Steroidobacteraceae bacterium]